MSERIYESGGISRLQVTACGRRRGPFLSILTVHNDPAELELSDVEQLVASLQTWLHEHGSKLANARITELEKRVQELDAGLRNALAAIDRDRTGLAGALVAVRDHAKSSWWITEGRGSYEWNDDRYKAETFTCLRQIIVLADDGLLASGRLADTEYKAARTALESPNWNATGLERVTSILNAVDPEGLLKMGAPPDEYESEARILLARVLRQPLTAQYVRDVWLVRFACGTSEHSDEMAIGDMPMRPEFEQVATQVNAEFRR